MTRFSADDLQLPLNARGLEVDNVAVEFRRDGKVLFIPKDRPYHIAIQPGHKSGVLDVHKKTHPATYETLASIPREVIHEILSEFGPSFTRDFVSLWRPIDFEWMAGRRLGVVPLPDESDLPSIARLNKRKRLEIDPVLLTKLMEPPEFLDEIFSRPDSPYLILDSQRRPYGLLIVKTTWGANRFALWAKLIDLARLCSHTQEQLLDAYRQRTPQRSL